MILTKEQAIIEHRKMWNWIADQYKNRTDLLNETEDVEGLKKYYIDTVFPNEWVECNCFCCEYDVKFGGICDQCPVEWNSVCDINMCLYKDYGKKNLYGELFDVNHDGCFNCDFSYCADLARQIANLPERK